MLHERGRIEVKGKGIMRTRTLVGLSLPSTSDQLARESAHGPRLRPKPLLLDCGYGRP